MYSSSINSNRLSSTSRSGGGSVAFAPLSISTSAAAASEAETLDRRASTNTASVDGRPPLLVQGTLVQSQSQQQPAQPSSSYTYYRGGFSTSLCDLFHDPRDRASCCALTCCGTFLQDRNRYVLTGELPPPWWMRIVGYVGGFIVSVVIGAVSGIPVLAIVLPVVFCVVMMMRATALRQQVRWLLIQKMAQTHPQHNHEGEPAYASMRSEHWCCAIVSNDKRRYIHLPSTSNNNNTRHSLEYDADSNFDNNPHAHSNIQRELEHTQHLERQQRRQQADFCFRLWQCLAWTCCDACCFSWCQCCGMCAIGQEDRELRRLLPPQVFLRDYITFQPYGEYYPPIEWLRQEQEQQEQLDDNDQMPTTTTRSTWSLFWKHLGTLSLLSQKLLHMLVASLALLLVASVLHLIANFSIAKVVVILATLAQAFLILYLVYWRHHRNDISLDAIIKFFASGFVLAMMAALVVELILDLMGEIVFSIVMTNEYIDDHPEMTFDDDRTTNHGGPFANMDTFKTMAKSHYLTLLAYLFFKAVIVAALVEELTKYYCFWMVEHPDFIYASSSSSSSSLSTGSSLALSEWNNESNSSLGEEGAFCNSVTAANAAATTSQGVAPPMSPSEAATTNLPPFRPRKAPSHTTAGAMITVGMIATAAGFSCSENLMYVFSQNSVAGEISVLVARSALPVHSICAAIQSIGVARRDVEQDADYKIGWAILPAVMLHGIFDFALLALAFFEYIFSDTTPQPAKYTSAPITTNNDDWKGLVDDDQYAGGAYQDVPAATLGQQLLSFGVGAAITMVGVLYYVNEAGKQRGRLQALELTTAEVPSTAGMVFA